MYRRNPRADVQRISQVLDGVEFPAAKWQLVMQAEEYGADSATRAELWALPAGNYADLTAVLASLGLADAPSRSATRYRTQPAPQVAGRVRPIR